MRKLLYIILCILITACVGGSGVPTDADAPKDTGSVATIVNIVDTTTLADTTLMSLTPRQVDSLVFRLTHHYSENFNFRVKVDSLRLIPREGDLLTDTFHVHAGDIIAVADIKNRPNDTIDSIWVKVASNQHTMGWIPERELLRGTTPDDLISQLLHTLSSSRFIWMSAIMALGLCAVFIRRRKNMKARELLDVSRLLNEMKSPYPALFLMSVAIMASLYASVQNFVPEFWQEYYYHPTLNPLVLPPLMAALVVTLWLVIINYIAIIEEVYHHFYFLPGIIHLAKIGGVGMVVYLVVSWTTLIYIGYIILALMIFFFGKIIIKNVKE